MLRDAERRLHAEHVRAELVEGDAEALPFPDDRFDVVISAFGAMFTPDQRRTAAELTRVCRRGGRIALACWSGRGAMGRLFRLMSRYVPPTPGVPNPTRWGDPDQLGELFGEGVRIEHCELRQFMFRYHSPQHWMEQFRTHFGPTRMTFSLLPEALATSLSADLIGMWSDLNQVADGRLIAPVDYLETVLVKV
jgi:SAM-dependent methyltransferase